MDISEQQATALLHGITPSDDGWQVHEMGGHYYVYATRKREFGVASYEVANCFTQRDNARFIAAAPSIVRALLQANQREAVDDGALGELRALVEQAQNNETRGRGCCQYCGHDDYPVDENGEEIEGEDVSSAAGWWIDHAEWCPSVIMPRLLEHIAALEAALASAQDELARRDKPPY